jgi:hypothetical protein
LLWLIMKSFLWLFALCSGMYRSFSSLGKWRQLVLINCLTTCPGTMWSGKFTVASCRDPEWKLPTPQLLHP